MTEKILHNDPHPLGAHMVNGGVRFSFVSRSAACGILLYNSKTGKLREKIPFTEDERIGHVYCKIVKNIDPSSTTYLFFEEDRLVPDERARVFPHRVPYGRERTVEDMRAGFVTGTFDWEQDHFPRLPYNKVIVCCMHARGFTKHASSGVKHRGTFAGIAEKIPYLKEIGITTIELQPAYEFAEVPFKGEPQNQPHMTDTGILEKNQQRLNYWGYKKGYYFVPKSAYAASEDTVTEFKELIRALHANGMEMVMQFYFPEEVKHSEIPEILRYWVLEYHVDGFHLMGGKLPAELLAADELLADTKIWYYGFDTDRLYGRNEPPQYPHVAEYNDAWYYDMRRFLKGDGGMLGSVLYHMRHIPEKAGCIHYLTNYYGFTLADLVSYDHKHNEPNGEDNRDGSDCNCSWNCGEEGRTRRQAVKQLRIRQIKNAMCLLMLSQSTPLIFMGDEFGNSQKGNNNPYCQDNAVAWLDWSQRKKNEEIFDFWKMLVRFRREHPILRPDRELRLMDYIACGYPDLSYHGQNAWCPETDAQFRHIGILLYGKYARDGEIRDDTFLYIAVNMHWERHRMALPRLPKGAVWELVFATESGESSRKRGEDTEKETEFIRKIPPRSMAVYISVWEETV